MQKLLSEATCFTEVETNFAEKKFACKFAKIVKFGEVRVFVKLSPTIDKTN